ncbi:MAG: hypothetical protein OET63_04920 [Desulfobacterales bacterium]|nr:hypothetical protein [Desulfobacterales bacterium]
MVRLAVLLALLVTGCATRVCVTGMDLSIMAGNPDDLRQPWGLEARVDYFAVVPHTGCPTPNAQESE